MKVSMVVAAADNDAIGLKGNLLWQLPDDMQFFKEVTRGHHVLMGRKSWEALPEKWRPLPGRVNIVVTRKNDFNAAGATVVSNIDEGIALANKNGETELMVIGGGEIYRQALSKTDKIYLTRVHHVFTDADAFFPALDNNEWEETDIRKHPSDARHQYAFDFTTWERKKK